jgi:hypothetical protein
MKLERQFSRRNLAKIEILKKNQTNLGINNSISWMPVAQACNPSYSGGRDQEECSSKLAQANSW